MHCHRNPNGKNNKSRISSTKPAAIHSQIISNLFAFRERTQESWTMCRLDRSTHKDLGGLVEEAAFVFLCGELPHIVAAILELGFSSLDIYPPMCNPVRAIVSIYRFVHRYKTPPRFKAVDASFTKHKIKLGRIGSFTRCLNLIIIEPPPLSEIADTRRPCQVSVYLGHQRDKLRACFVREHI